MPEGDATIDTITGVYKGASWFEREAWDLYGIVFKGHPNLVRIAQVWCQPGYVVVAMEVADGSLADLLDGYQLEFNTPIPPEELCGYMLQAADALDFLHRTREELS